jgi:phosphoribosylanthranilate isomerase
MKAYPCRRTRVKICGFTRPEDVSAAVYLGVDAIGLVFYDQSPRSVTVEQAKAIVATVPAFVSVVGLFVDESTDTIRRISKEVRLDLLQFHGEEPPEFCRAFARPYIKAVRVRRGVDLPGLSVDYGDAQGLLVDAWRPDEKGGTGHSFDWNLIHGDCELPLILAGGLQPGNVQEAIQKVRPYAVDVSSGVESAKGVKDPDKMALFLEEVYRFDNQQSPFNRAL